MTQKEIRKFIANIIAELKANRYDIYREKEYVSKDWHVLTRNPDVRIHLMMNLYIKNTYIDIAANERSAIYNVIRTHEIERLEAEKAKASEELAPIIADIETWDEEQK